MQADFWHQRWANNQIGFHQSETSPYLQRFWSGLNLEPGAQVLVPLCGKSLDMTWLTEQGYRVLGVELSEKAVQAFFRDQELTPSIRQQGGFTVYSAQAMELWCGDFFDLRPDDVADCAALYDRAALIALPRSMREGYAEHLNTVLPHGCQGLLITLDYDQTRLDGPPFSVADEEVQTLLSPAWRLEVLQACDVLEQSPKFLKAGVDQLYERAYRLSRRRL